MSWDFFKSILESLINTYMISQYIYIYIYVEFKVQFSTENVLEIVSMDMDECENVLMLLLVKRHDHNSIKDKK